MDEYFADKLTEIQDTEDTAYLLENNEIFYDVGYKVMQNQENANLLSRRQRQMCIRDRNIHHWRITLHLRIWIRS